MSRTALIAIGGNALAPAGDTEGLADANARQTSASIVGIMRHGYRVVITHGNGPQVGAQLFRSEHASAEVPTQPLDVCGAATQGEIGYLLAKSLYEALSAGDLHVPVVVVITQTIVSRDDPAMSHPTKPIGPFYSRAEAERHRCLYGWDIVEDSAHGYRRVVPSPGPIDVVELEVIRSLVAEGVLVIAAGGGGIPVVRSNNALVGIEAVIDKDRTSAFLASRLGAELLIISMDADFVYLDYNRPTQWPLKCVTAPEIDTYLRAGQFPPGSMGPKIESALRFLREGGNEVIITSSKHLCAAITESAGTHIYPDDESRKRACLATTSAFG
jgi:carbamate kinase